MNFSNKIKEICLSAGFAKCGFTDAFDLHSEREYLSLWLNQKKYADMGWMLRSYERRTNPFEVMPDLKSIISLAYIYDTPFTHKDEKNIPKISRYAWGNVDYHILLKEKLKKICSEIESLDKDIRTKFFVDDGSVLEKDWAKRAGIGWMGKNTIIINENFGSFIFLCEIFINRKLESDLPAEDLCNGCSLCVKSCPTGALEEYKLNPELCISYHTIENKSDIPDYIDTAGWLFGCDTCQDICPYNRRKFFTENKCFEPQEKYFNKDISLYDSVTESVFNEDFKSTPLKRLKFERWKRNIKKLKK